jgi:hypothetical protein
MDDFEEVWMTPRGTGFKYRKDFLGDITIQCSNGTVVIPAQDILDLVAWCYIARQKIARIEQSTTDELLLGLEYKDKSRKIL